MFRLLVASHGPLSKAIVESAALIAGEEAVKDIKTISITMSTSYEETKELIDQAFMCYEHDDFILALTDVYGGSITRVLSEYVGTRNLHIITGVNLGMLLEALFAKDMYGKDELITYLMKNGKDGIQYVNDDLQNKEGDEI